MGELLELTWDCVDIAPVSIEQGGDMKAVQGGSDHAQVKMVVDVYFHIIGDDRRLNAERLEEAFYGGNKTEPAPQPASAQLETTPQSDQELLLSLLQKPVFLHRYRFLNGKIFRNISLY